MTDIRCDMTQCKHNSAEYANDPRGGWCKSQFISYSALLCEAFSKDNNKQILCVEDYNRLKELDNNI
jgi:hypothetical protein